MCAYDAAMFRSARYLKVLIASPLIAIYLMMAIGGDVLHFHYCSSHDCENVRGRNSSPACEIDAPCLDSCAESFPDLRPANEFESSNGFPWEQEQENSSSGCWTCYMLSQAGDTPCEDTLLVSNDFVGVASTSWATLYLPVSLQAFLARGPPRFLLPQS